MKTLIKIRFVLTSILNLSKLRFLINKQLNLNQSLKVTSIRS